MKEKHLQFDEGKFAAEFPELPFTIKHSLPGHPLFELPRLISLARALPACSVEYNAGNLPVSQDPKKTPLNGLSVEDTIQRIEECKSWMVLKNVEKDPAYNALLDECLDQVQEVSDSIVPGMSQREGFIFISSPRSVTPFHIDPEHNFLCQVRGEKTVYIFPQDDRSLISEEELEGFYNGAHRNLTYKEDYQRKGSKFLLRPGDALHFPVTAPHWVQNEDAVSISFSITFRSDSSKRRAQLYFMNAKLRRIGIKPAPVGKSEWLDGVKHTAFQVASKVRHSLGA